MKLSRDDILNKISTKITDEDLAIELMEDITDSIKFVEPIDNSKELDDLRSTIESRDSEIADLKRKYKERFLDPEAIKEIIPEPIQEQKRIIDIREI